MFTFVTVSLSILNHLELRGNDKRAFYNDRQLKNYLKNVRFFLILGHLYKYFNFSQTDCRLQEISKIDEMPQKGFFYKNLLHSMSQILELMETNTKMP